MECGPLARLAVSGEYTNGVSVLDRHRARAQEALRLARAMQAWLAALTDDATGYAPYAVPDSTAAPVAGLAEAPRGALGHWLGIAAGKVAQYQIITPSCWNVSPRDAAGQRGPLEQALIGTPIANAEEPVEALRVIHSIDPCLDCATHVMRADGETRVFALGGLPQRVRSP
jgi:hydrogenase large subunit